MPPKTIPDTIPEKTFMSQGYDYPHILKHRSEQVLKQGVFPGHEIWPSFLLFSCLFLVFFSFINLNKKFTLLFKSCFSIQASRSLEREDFRLSTGGALSLTFVFLFTLSFLIYKINIESPFIPFSAGGTLLFLFILVFVTLLYLIKLLILKLSGWLFLTEKETAEYIFNIIIISQVAGVFLLLVGFGLEFLRLPDFPVIVFGVSAFGIFYLVRLIKGFFITSTKSWIV